MSIKKASGKKVMSAIGYIIVALFATIFVMDIYRGLDGKETSILGYKPIIVISGSMEPDIMTNSMGIVKDCTLEDVKVGDIILFKHHNMKIIHRAIEVLEDSRGKYVLTKGDANELADGIPITDDTLIGKLTWHTNKVVPIISYFMISPGEVNPVAVTQSLIMLIITTSILAILGNKITRIIKVVYIVAVKKESLPESNLQKLIDRQNELKHKVSIIENNEMTIKNKLLLAKVAKEVDNLQISIDDFDKELELAMKINNWVNEDKHTMED